MIESHAQALTFSFVWLCLVTLAYYGLQRWPSKWLVHLGPVLLVASFIRIVPLFLLPFGANYDVESFQRVGQTLIQGQEVYSSPLVAGRHPYLPMQLYIIGGAMKASLVTHTPFLWWLKMPNVLADLAITALLYKASLRAGRSNSVAAGVALLYGLNPVALLISAYHGQFDAFTLLLLLLSWHSFQFSPRHYATSALWLGLATLNKTWPLLFLPVVWLRLPNWRARCIFPLLTLAVPAAGVILYAVLWQAGLAKVLQRPLTHIGVPGYWGLSAVLNIMQTSIGHGAAVLAGLLPLSRYVLLAGVLATAWLTRRQSIMNAWTTVLLVVYALTLGFGLQYLVWIIPFAAWLDDRRGLNWFTLGALIYLGVNYYGVHLDDFLIRTVGAASTQTILQIVAIPVWLTSLAWLMMRWRKRTSAISTDALQATILD
jgi:hypothetical protein